jgi:hypothetical protein
MATNPSLELIGPITRGRPSLYTDELAAEICERIAAGETLLDITDDEDMPARSTVTKWLMEDRGGFYGQYARARAIQAHVEDDANVRIADNAYEDYHIAYDKDGNPFVEVNGESVRRAQLRIETRKWRAERLNRIAYGNSTRHEHAMAEPGAPALKPGCLPGSLSFLDRSGESEPG